MIKHLLFPRKPEVSLSGRVRDSGAKQLLAKQLGQIQSPTFMDLQTGQIKSKKPPKEKSPEQISVFELKTLQRKLLT